MELETEAADTLHWRTQVWSQPTVAQLAEQQTVVGGGGGLRSVDICWSLVRFRSVGIFKSQ